jgi:hypothetical protein
VTTAGGITLAISILAFAISAFTFVRSEVAGRNAFLTVRWEFQVTPPANQPDNVFVINNAGPSLARDVNLTIVKRDGSAPDPARRGAVEGPLPLHGLPSGHEFRAPFFRAYGESYEAVEVTWRDGRRGVQRLVAPISRVTVGSAIIVNVDARPPYPGSSTIRQRR